MLLGAVGDMTTQETLNLPTSIYLPRPRPEDLPTKTEPGLRTTGECLPRDIPDLTHTGDTHARPFEIRNVHVCFIFTDPTTTVTPIDSRSGSPHRHVYGLLRPFQLYCTTVPVARALPPTHHNINWNAWTWMHARQVAYLSNSMVSTTKSTS